MTRSDYQREQRQMRRRIRELLAARRSGPDPANGDGTDTSRAVADQSRPATIG
jgi:hypothetical protein